MSILERLKSDMIEATKARESQRLGVIRFVRSEMKNREIELGRDLKDEDAIEVLSRVAKRHREAIEQFGPAGRDDLVVKEQAGLAVVSQYLPEQLSEDAVSLLIDEAITESGATSVREMGLVMKTVMPKVKGRADGSVIKAMVEKRLAGGEG